MNEWFVYILECRDGSYYTGMTCDINRRMLEHSKGVGSKYVKKKGFKQLIYYKKCLTRQDACRKEYFIKQLPRFQKLEWFRRSLNE